ncbi:hypothetical protein CC85DRAFT_91877 [Cutaneotrichosporon oleaginosum]|uniref:Uncharacterized protein n=1 Tax=Cutaneotrichosporon oleaginosum TaxID=879819 RepID=A0A0J1BDC1_9TREE|nr:uncharacterized protein CC85DRAFT_91877 [Cutaneotrichosporon oleaginosum]KLT46054.1 hypothetical protein CC85DRAFT_91877 [Cutaneotrichosporon oleaginosum]TXT06747.1 hypothetical protein COLE_06078 [Cutaneotrichosporon oleaginosum]
MTGDARKKGGTRIVNDLEHFVTISLICSSECVLPDMSCPSRHRCHISLVVQLPRASLNDDVTQASGHIPDTSSPSPISDPGRTSPPSGARKWQDFVADTVDEYCIPPRSCLALVSYVHPTDCAATLRPNVRAACADPSLCQHGYARSQGKRAETPRRAPRQDKPKPDYGDRRGNQTAGGWRLAGWRLAVSCGDEAVHCGAGDGEHVDQFTIARADVETSKQHANIHSFPRLTPTGTALS